MHASFFYSSVFYYCRSTFRQKENGNQNRYIACYNHQYLNQSPRYGCEKHKKNIKDKFWKRIHFGGGIFDTASRVAVTVDMEEAASGKAIDWLASFFSSFRLNTRRKLELKI